jgi:Putative prokaryotic signal transducing protein
MKELVRSNDAVRLSWLQAVLADAGIETVMLDNHTSIVEGSIGAIQRRLMVDDADHARACAALRAAEAELRREPQGERE